MSLKSRYILLDIEQIIIIDNPGFTELQKNKIQKEYQDEGTDWLIELLKEKKYLQ